MMTLMRGFGINSHREYTAIGDSDGRGRTPLVIYCPVDAYVYGVRIPFEHMINKTTIISQPEK